MFSNFIYQLYLKQHKYLRFIIPKFIRRKIKKKFFPFYFLLTNLKYLPPLNYINNNHYEIQRELIAKFKTNQKQTSFMTCPYLHELLLMKYKKNEIFSFLDIGGEYIDFFLELKKNFNNVNYYLINIEKINNNFKKIKKEYDLKNLFIINDFLDIYKNQYDFINVGSTIQYINNYEDVLKNITKISRNIFFSGTILFESENENYKKHIITKQINCFPDINYCFFFNKKYFYNYFYNDGFNLLFSKKNLTDNINFVNFKNIFKQIDYKDFLFVKKNEK